MPFNPRFVAVTNGTARAEGGFRPSPVDLSYLTAAYKAYRARQAAGSRKLLKLGAVTEPSRWDSRDVEGENWVTPVGNQLVSGPCWAFATVACLETALIKNGEGVFDLSENHLTASHEGFLWGPYAGGNVNMATALTTRWSDPLLEEQDPFPNFETPTNAPPFRHVQNVEWIPARADSTDNAELKRAIRTYGAVMVGYHASGTYNPQTGAYYYNGTSAANHAVAVIGWDDNYAVENFAEGYRPPTPGAFLIKNSWGANAYETTNGYNWVSYCDTQFAMSESIGFFAPETTNNYGRVYEYDPCGLVTSYGYGTNTIWAANVFSASVTGVVDAVGFYAMTPGTTYEINVYTNCTAGRPTSGACAVKMTGESSIAGYLTVPLPSGVALETPGLLFSVVLKLTSPGEVYPLAVEYAYDGYCEATASRDESFISSSGTSWTDLQDAPGLDGTGNCCIKAYTRYGSDGPEPRDPMTLHVDAESVVSDPDGSPERPFATIGAAVGASQADDVILVAPGVYAESVVAPEHAVTILSSEGPAETFIDPDYADRCYVGATTALLAGFTLRHGAAEYGGGVGGGTVSNCVIVGCEANYGGGASAATLIGCTVYGNIAWQAGGGVDGDCICRDSIVYFNYCDADAQYDNWEKYRQYYRTYTTRLQNSCSYPSGFTNAGGSITNDPSFVNLSTDDWRLRTGSPCLGTASDGANMGVYQGAGVSGYQIVVMRKGKGEIEPALAFVPEGESVSFTATSPYHAFGGFATNGVFATTEPTFVWSNVTADATLEATFLPTNFYVDAAASDDAGDGLAWSRARRTLQSALADAGEGDLLSVAPGIYEPVWTEDFGMTVVATGGVAVTAIDAGQSNRCVAAYYNDITFCGFTLRNASKNGYYGGGVYGCTLVGCVISNCLASAGGGAAYACLTNCLVVGNSASYGGGLFDCIAVNCTVADNQASWYGGGAYLDAGCLAVNTSFATNVCDRGYANGNDVYGMGFHTMTNCLVDRDARYVDPAHGDYRLSANSPCLDAGRNDLVAGVTSDLVGTNRLFGSAVDIGCYEYSHVPAGWPATDVMPTDTPAQAAAKVQAALTDVGFPSAKAARVETAAQYAALSGWAETRGFSAATLAASPTVLLSAALWADVLLDLEPADLSVDGLEKTDAGWSMLLTLDAYDRLKVNEGLLKAAVGVVGADALQKVFTTEGLAVTVEPVEEGVRLSVTPPSSPTYFLKAEVR